MREVNQTVKTNVLKGKIVENGMTIGKFCEIAGFSRATFDRKMSDPGKFDRDEIIKIVDILDLTWEETRNIFFDDKVS